MPVVDAKTGEPLSDDPDQEDERLRGGKGKGWFVSATDGPEEGSGVVTGPSNDREAQPGIVQGDGPDPSSSNSTGGA
jgi:hypothetical protein